MICFCSHHQVRHDDEECGAEMAEEAEEVSLHTVSQLVFPEAEFVEARSRGTWSSDVSLLQEVCLQGNPR